MVVSWQLGGKEAEWFFWKLTALPRKYKADFFLEGGAQNSGPLPVPFQLVSVAALSSRKLGEGWVSLSELLIVTGGPARLERRSNAAVWQFMFGLPLTCQLEMLV
jgi:hypothetical protein